MVTPILLLLLLSVSVHGLEMRSSWAFALLVSVSAGWLYEVTRKTKGADEETKDLSYSRMWGPKKAAEIVFLSAIVSNVLTYFFFESLGIASRAHLIALVVLTLLVFLTCWQYAQHSLKKNRKKNEGATGLVSLYTFLTPIVIALCR